MRRRAWASVSSTSKHAEMGEAQPARPEGLHALERVEHKRGVPVRRRAGRSDKAVAVREADADAVAHEQAIGLGVEVDRVMFGVTGRRQDA